MAEVLKVFAAVFVAVVALGGARVSGQTHHVLGGNGGLDVGSWLSGRVFRVGDKIWFNCSGTEDSIVELKGPEEFHSCDLTNPIKMYTDTVSHVELEQEGIRYFTSGNLETCKNGLKLPVPVQSHEYGPPPEYGPPSHEYAPPSHEYGPPSHEYAPPSHEYGPPSHEYGPPSHEDGPPPPLHPPPQYGPPEPVRPPTAFGPPPPRPPSAATYLNGLSFVLFAGWLICYLGM